MPHLPGKRAVGPLTCGGDKEKKHHFIRGEEWENTFCCSEGPHLGGGGQGESEGWM